MTQELCTEECLRLEQYTFTESISKSWPGEGPSIKNTTCFGMLSSEKEPSNFSHRSFDTRALQEGEGLVLREN